MNDLCVHILSLLVIADLVLMVRRLDAENGDLRHDAAELRNSLPVRGWDGRFRGRKTKEN